jgi:hypothetical protein
MPDGQSLQSTFRRGWYFGTEEFRDKLLGLLGRKEDFSKERQKGYQGRQTSDHGIAEGERIIVAAGKGFDLDDAGWSGMKKGD